MQEKKFVSIRDYLMILAPLVISTVIQVAISIMGMEFAYIGVISKHKSGGFVSLYNEMLDALLSIEVNTYISVAYATVSIVVCLIWYYRTFGKKETFRRPFKNLTSNWGLFVAGIALISVGMQYLCVYITNAIAVVRPDIYQEYQKLLEMAGFTDDISVGLVIYAVILGPISEELIFRGLTLKYARKVMPFVWANVAQALMFALFHQNTMQGMYTFFVGLAFGYIAYKYDSIVVSIISHMLFNVFGTIGSMLVPDVGNTMWTFYIMLMMAAVLTYVGMIILMKALPVVNNRENRTDM